LQFTATPRTAVSVHDAVPWHVMGQMYLSQNYNK
jgi:hypothetical protein